MIDRLKSLYLDEIFRPSFIGIFINPVYFIRKGLYRGVLRNKKFLQGTLLDFGCGDKPYRHIIEVQEYIGLELESGDPDKKNKSVDVYYDGKHIPFMDNHFDSVFSTEVFEHVFNLEQVIIELNRVLKAGGHMLITLPFVWHEHDIPFDFARYTSFGIINLLERNGFEVVVIEKTTNYVETVFQMWNEYVHQYVFPSNNVVKALLTPIFIGPVTVLGLILSFILPRNKDFFHNSIVVARKK
jgi:SAM-dependent methyltransferase